MPSKRFQLVIVPAEAEAIEALRVRIHAASLGEVIRCAVSLLDRMVEKGILVEPGPEPEGRTGRMQLILSERTQERLERLVDHFGLSASAVVRLAWRRYETVAEARLAGLPCPARTRDGEFDSTLCLMP